MAVEARVGRMAIPAGILAFAAGCASTPVAHKDLLEFLGQPSVTAAQVRERLGEPSATFERDRVLAYRLGHNASGYYVAPAKTGWEGVQYDLIVVVDERNVVQQHSLVGIRPP